MELVMELYKKFVNEKTVEMVTNITVGVLIRIIVFFIVYKLGIKFIKKLFEAAKKMPERKSDTLRSVTINVYKVIVIFLLIVTILNMFGIDPTSIVALFSVFSLAVGLAAQNVIKDFIAGFLLLLEDQFALQDTIVINNEVTGVVENLGLRTTSLRTVDGELYIVPNGYIQTIKTYSKEFSRAKVVVGVDYSTDIDKCLKILEDEMRIANNEIEAIINIPLVQGVVELNQSSVDIRILAECKIDEKWAVERELRRRIKNRFDKENIVIPFPQRVVHMQKED